MFGRLFGSSNASPSPPKNQIEVVCPACGAAQYEPRLCVSTFCKRCGVHLRLEKKKVIASEVSKAGGRPEALAPTRQPEPAKTTVPDAVRNLNTSGTRPLTRPLTQVPLGGTATPPAEQPFEADISETGELGLGMMLRAVSTAPASPAAAPAPAAPPAPEPVTALPVIEQQMVEAAPGTKVSAQIPTAVAELMQPPIQQAAATGTLQKMRDQGAYRQQYFKEAECFECGNKFKVGRSSRSANCPGCGAYISIEDIELNMPSTQPIKTRGDVLIRKRGHLAAAHLYARELRCYGVIEANVFCYTDAIYKCEGTMVGEVRCRKFIVEKGSIITFMNEVHAEEVEIHGTVTGNLFSKGPLTIHSTGAVNGDVTARSVSIEPGGALNGSMNIVRTPKPGSQATPA